MDRGYGHNFNPSDRKDVGLIDFIQALNSLLLEKGVIKPTIMFAVMTPSGSAPTKCHGVLTPQFAVRAY